MNDHGMMPVIVMDEATQARLVMWCPLLLQEGHYPVSLAALGCKAEPFWAVRHLLYVNQELSNRSSPHFNKTRIQELWVSS